MPNVRRFFVAVDGLRQLSGLRWGEGDPEIVLVHGGAQNAHTFDTVALALQRPLVALDLPGHGHSDPLALPAVGDRPATPSTSSARSTSVTESPCRSWACPSGDSARSSSRHDRPDLVRSLVLIDITPGVNAEKSRHITDFVNGPTDLRQLRRRCSRAPIEHNPTRSVSSLRRGILHNAVQRPDGTWVWRHQQHAPSTPQRARRPATCGSISAALADAGHLDARAWRADRSSMTRTRPSCCADSRGHGHPRGARRPLDPRRPAGRTRRRCSSESASRYYGWRGRARTSNLRIQSPSFCQLNYPPLPILWQSSEILRVCLKMLNTNQPH